MQPTDLRILQVSTLEMTGGAARIAWNLHRAYGERALRSWMAVGYKRNDDSNVFLIPNEQAHGLWTRSILGVRRKLHLADRHIQGARRLNQILTGIADPVRLWDLYRGIEEFRYPGSWRLLDLPPERPDIVHGHNLHGGYFDLRALPWLSHQVSVILTLHDAWLLSGHCAHSFECERWRTGCGQCPYLNLYPSVWRDATQYNWQRKRDIFSKSRLYIATPSQWLMSKVKQSILMQAAVECRVIPNGVDTEIFYPSNQLEARHKVDLPLDASILLFASHGVRRNPWRDYELLEETIRRLSQVETREYPLVMVCLGEAGEPQRFGDAEIQFVPFQDNLEGTVDYYRSADVYLHPAKADTFPNTVLEALACGTPVVATAVGGIPEQIEDGVNGFLVPPGNAEAMAARVQQLLADNDLHKRFAAKAAESARQRFDLNRQVDTYLAWYNEIVQHWQREHQIS